MAWHKEDAAKDTLYSCIVTELRENRTELE